MATWDEFCVAEPELGRVGHELLFQVDAGFGLLATIRADDQGPRLHPVCPFIGQGKLFLATPRSSPKSGDLRRDPRYMLHAVPGDRDAEFSIRGRARLVTDPDERALAERSVSFASGVRPHDDAFVLDIERADSTTWANWAQADTYPIRKKWIASDA